MTEQETKRDEVMRLLVEHQPMLKTFIFSMVGNWSLAEECVQEVTVYICDHWEDWRPGTDFGKWIRAAGRIRVRELIRKERRHQFRRSNMVDVDLAATLPDQVWASASDTADHQLRALKDCCAKLPKESRRLLEMRHVGRRGCKEIAKALQINVVSVYKRLLRIREALSKCISSKISEYQ